MLYQGTPEKKNKKKKQGTSWASELAQLWDVLGKFLFLRHHRCLTHMELKGEKKEKKKVGVMFLKVVFSMR